MLWWMCYILEKWFPLKSERVNSLYFVIHVNDERTISGVDLIETRHSVEHWTRTLTALG